MEFMIPAHHLSDILNDIKENGVEQASVVIIDDMLVINIVSSNRVSSWTYKKK